jgi:hypothetical protein
MLSEGRNVATPGVPGSGDGARSAAPGTAVRGTQAVRSFDRPRCPKRPSVLGRGRQPADGETLTTPPDNQHQRRPAVALSAVINSRRREISARYLSEDERIRIADLRRAGHGGPGDRGRSGAQRGNGQPRAAPEHRSDQRPVPALHRAAARHRASGSARPRQADPRSGVAAFRAGPAHEAVEPRADLSGVAPGVPGETAGSLLNATVFSVLGERAGSVSTAATWAAVSSVPHRAAPR